MKRMLSLALAGVMLASLAACGGKEPSKSAGSTPPAGSGGNTSAVEPVKPPESAPESNGLNADNLKLYQKGYFNDGVAFIYFKDEVSGQKYAGLIDTDGKLQSYIEFEQGTSYNVDGYTYVQSNEKLYVLDNDFTVLTSYSLNTAEEERVVSYGGGYFVTERKNTGFDASSPYLNHIFDCTGKELSSHPNASTTYLGKGAFSFGSQGDLYFAKLDTWLNDIVNDGSYFKGNLLFCYDDYNRQGDFVDENGAIYMASLPDYSVGAPSYYGEANGFALIQFNDNKGTLGLYDTKSGQFKEYQGTYADRMARSYFGNQCHGNIFGIAVYGGDNQSYTVLLNENLEELCEPVLGEPFAIRDNCFFTKSDSELIAYNLQGEELYRARGSFTEAPPFWYDGKDDIMPVGDGYFHSDGTEIEIDYSTGKLVTLPE